MKRLLFAFGKSRKKVDTKRPANRTLQLEQCEDRRLMAFNVLQAYAPIAPDMLIASAPVALVAPATLPATGQTPVPAPITIAANTTAATPPATTTADVTVQKAAATKIDLDVTIQSGAVTPTQAKDLNLLHVFGGEKLTIPTVVKNYGPGAANGSATVAVYLSTTRDLNTSPVLLGQKTVSVNLGNNATQSVSLDVTVPTTLTAGTKYWIVAKVTTPLTQSTINDIRNSDRQFEFVGTPTVNKAAFQPDANGKILYFQFIRDTLNSRFVAIDRDITVRINDPQSFIGSFEGDKVYPYLKDGAPTIGVGINLNTLNPYMEHLVATHVRGFYQNNYGQKLTGTDAAVIGMLKVQAFSGSTKQAISSIQNSSLFDASYPGRQLPASTALGSTIWSRINPMARIALMDQVYATGNIYANMVAPLKALDYVRAGFQLVDNKRTTQSAELTIRAEAEYTNLLYSTRTSLGAVI